MSFVDEVEDIFQRKEDKEKKKIAAEQALSSEIDLIGQSIYKCISELHEAGYDTNIRNLSPQNRLQSWPIRIKDITFEIVTNDIVEYLKANPGSKAEDRVKRDILLALEMDGDVVF